MLAMANAAGASSLSLSLLDGFELRDGRRLLAVPLNVQRLLAFLAIRHRPQPRTTVAATLWLDSPEDRAASNLRTALWRARRLGHDVVVTTGSYVGIGPRVAIDFDRVLAIARRVSSVDVSSGGAVDGAVDLDDAGDDTVDLAGDLLPDWSEDWVLIERERLRQMRMHALEALCSRLTDAGRYAQAIEAGLAAIAVEPLRESAHRALVGAYLAEGNACEAVRHYESFRTLLFEGLGIEPSAALTSQVAASSGRSTDT